MNYRLLALVVTLSGLLLAPAHAQDIQVASQNFINIGNNVLPDNFGLTNFGNRFVDTTTTRAYYLFNPDSAHALTISSIVGSSEFKVDTANTNFTVAPGSSTFFLCGFTPTSGGLRGGSVHIISNAPGGSALYILNMQGAGIIGPDFPEHPNLAVHFTKPPKVKARKTINGTKLELSVKGTIIDQSTTGATSPTLTLYVTGSSVLTPSGPLQSVVLKDLPGQTVVGKFKKGKFSFRVSGLQNSDGHVFVLGTTADPVDNDFVDNVDFGSYTAIP